KGRESPNGRATLKTFEGDGTPRLARRHVADERPTTAREGVDVKGRDKHSRFIGHYLGQATDAVCTHRYAAGERFEGRNAKTFSLTGQHEHVCLLQVADKVR